MTRRYWLDSLLLIAEPVIKSLAQNRLKLTLPTDDHPRADFAPLEAFARTLAGLAPWLELEDVPEDEADLQRRYRNDVLICIDHATNPESPDYMNWGDGGDQPLVDAGFLSQALLRAPRQIVDKLPLAVQERLVVCLKKTRSIWHNDNNWLFFSVMVESLLHRLDEPVLVDRIHLVIDTFEAWYRGDGVYSDGESLHVDYYNSFVIHPMYVDFCKTFSGSVPRCREMLDTVLRRARRYGVILERSIAADGTFPIVGRSACYRFGAFHLLAQLGWTHELDQNLPPSQVREALTAVLARTLEVPDNFDNEGWLLPGVAGFQAELAEPYINRGSLYLATLLFLPLGLPKSDEFWSGPELDWTMKRLWSGGQISIDHAID